MPNPNGRGYWRRLMKTGGKDRQKAKQPKCRKRKKK